MPDTVRLSISLEASLLQRLERLVKRSRYTNRSEFIRDLIRDKLVETEWAESKREVIGTITMIFDHHARQLTDKLTSIQHDHHDYVMATTHVHLTHDLCAEMIMLRGPARGLQHLADRLRQQRGVLHTELTMSSTGTTLR